MIAYMMIEKEREREGGREMGWGEEREFLSNLRHARLHIFWQMT